MKKSDDLGDEALSFVPAFLADETLYSFCARFHYMSANRLASTTSQQLFGVSNAAMLHDFPAHLFTFEVRTKGLLGNVSDLAYDRTLLKFYAPYQPVNRIRAGIEALAGPGIDRLKFRLGLASSRIGAAHPLKACVQCIREEIDTYGGAYWHLLHQHPAVWICPEHGELLMRSKGKSRTLNKLQWVLPNTLREKEWQLLPPRLKNHSLMLTRLTNFAAGILSSSRLELEPHSLRESYLYGVKSAGWLTRAGNVRLSSVRQEFLRQTAALIDIPEFKFIESVNGNGGGFLAKLLRNPRSHLHPAKHFLVKAFLFEDWTDFWNCYNKMVGQAGKSRIEISAGPYDDSRVDTLLTLVAAGKRSLAQAARDVNVPYDVARYWLQRAGVVYVRPSPSLRAIRLDSIPLVEQIF